MLQNSLLHYRAVPGNDADVSCSFGGSDSRHGIFGDRAGVRRNARDGAESAARGAGDGRRSDSAGIDCRDCGWSFSRSSGDVGVAIETGEAAIALVAGVGGLFFDSLLGATVERRGWIGNDLVNFSSTVFAALVAVGLLALLH